MRLRASGTREDGAIFVPQIAGQMATFRHLHLFCILQDDRGLRFDQFRIAPDMLVTLLLGQIAAVQIFGQLPKLGLYV